MLLELTKGAGVQLPNVSRMRLTEDGFAVFESTGFRVFVLRYELEQGQSAAEFVSRRIEPVRDALVAELRRSLCTGLDVFVFEVNSAQHYVTAFIADASTLFEISVVDLEGEGAAIDAEFVDSMLVERAPGPNRT